MSQTPDDLLSTLQQYVNLGHAKRDQAFLRQVAMACSSPGTSAPQGAGKAAEKVPLADAMSLYRFVGNEQVSLAELRATRARTVRDGVEPGSDHWSHSFDFSRSRRVYSHLRHVLRHRHGGVKSIPRDV